MGLPAEARCCKIWFAPTSVVIWPSSHRPGKTRECLVSALMAQPAAGPQQPTEIDSLSPSCASVFLKKCSVVDVFTQDSNTRLYTCK